MKSVGLPLLFCVVTGSLAAQQPAPTNAAKTSPRLGQEIRANLPKYIPPAPTVLDQPKPIDEADPNVLLLPKVTVKEKRPLSHDPDVWLTDKAVRQKAMAAYKQSLTDFEWALNSWYIPIFGSSPSARARGAYQANKSFAEEQRVHELFNLISTLDARTGQELEQERIKMEQTEYWRDRPAGDGRAK
jgi:hypothetical protein